MNVNSEELSNSTKVFKGSKKDLEMLKAIPHVPSFLIKTYEFVQVSLLN